MRTLCLAICLIATSSAGAEELGQKRAGFAAETHIGTQLFSLGVGMGSVASFGTVSGGIFLGGKIDRFIFGLGFDLSRVASGSSQSGMPDTSQALTTIMFVPGIRAAIVRSHDQRVELFGQFDLGFGTAITESSPGGGGNQPTRFRLSYDVAPGVRFWAHPQFAVAGLAGLAGQFEFDSQTQNGITAKTSTGLTSIFAALQLLGVF